MQIKSNFEIVEIAGQHLLIPVGDESKSFNGVVAISEDAAFLLRNMHTPKTEDEIISLLLDNYEVNESVAQNDVHKFIGQLRQMKLIEE